MGVKIHMETITQQKMKPCIQHPARWRKTSKFSMLGNICNSVANWVCKSEEKLFTNSHLIIHITYFLWSFSLSCLSSYKTFFSCFRVQFSSYQILLCKSAQNVFKNHFWAYSLAKEFIKKYWCWIFGRGVENNTEEKLFFSMTYFYMKSLI